MLVLGTGDDSTGDSLLRLFYPEATGRSPGDPFEGGTTAMDDRSILAALEAVIAERKGRAPGSRSYVSSLLEKGVAAIGSKIHEEAAEVVEAAGEAGDGGQSHLVHEAADLVFHLLVLLGARGVAWSAVEAELSRRFGISGIDEKESRAGREE
jgi:phosphoribosyl-ATP pyrophosphohydrolase